MTTPAPQAFIPFRIDLEQQYAAACDLQAAMGAGDADALARVRRVYPDYRPGESMPTLGFQTVVAVELGLADWPALAAHVARMDEARRAIEAGEPAPDGDSSTLHIRCGSDLASTLPAAGFTGDFLEFSDAACQGPLEPGPAYTAARAAFLYKAYVRYFSAETGAASQADTEDRLDSQQQRLTEAAHYPRVVLWFEHDSFDQVILMQVLAHFARHGAPETLEMVTLDRFPGSARFIGLGQLPPEALRLLWPTRTAITAGQLALGRRTWDALCSTDPTDLLAMIKDPASEALPYLRSALRRYLQELPSTRDGLSLTERLVLELLREGDRTPGELFRDLMRGREPLPWMGDLMFLHSLRDMSRANPPVFTGWADPEASGWPQDRLTLTETGRAALAAEIDWMDLGPPARWIGGVKIDPAAVHWRWDDLSQSVRRHHARAANAR